MNSSLRISPIPREQAAGETLKIFEGLVIKLKLEILFPLFLTVIAIFLVHFTAVASNFISFGISMNPFLVIYVI